ncbi:hypothetical protein F7R26_025415 [Cupriavidus basilensis]|uniref:Site-2 protease family protein n=1 Tax=Cupriavidus basilensis TaxID=68895 RepID=A0A643FI76_9BURK|nr:hypothetical protein [Cupriavidus basilensis]QOT80757.1 hypothetical protein F7R26_025415 [Cupriavidus basilensis]
MTKLLLLLMGGLKMGKLLTTGGTMLLSIGAYALIFGWRYAVGFVLLILVHEMGHFLAARRRGLAVGALAYAGFFINLFNLIPLSPLDGGRVTAVLSPRIWFLGVPVLVAFLAVMRHDLHGMLGSLRASGMGA